jgi:beta-lactamase regulating signal transducer with metallopeptidase domain
MSTLSADSIVLSTLLWITIKASALLCIAALAQLVFFRRASAATRHIVWTLGIASMLLIPVVSTVLPPWPLVIHVAPKPEEPLPVAAPVDEVADAADTTTQPTLSSDTVAVPARSPVGSRSTAIVGLYLIGVFGLLIRLMVQRWHARRFARSAARVRDAEWMRLLITCADRMGVVRPVRLLRSREHNVPVALGTLRPAIVIPSIADTWSDDRRTAVMLHELAHVARYDCLTHTLAVAACAMYWFHPGVWWVARRLRIERELACDDRVIAAGTEPRDYAGHLLEIAYSFGGYRAPALAVSMARPRQLEGRMLAALDGARNRRVPSLRLSLAGGAIAIGLLAVLASARPAFTAATAAAAPREAQDEQWPALTENPALASTAKVATKRAVKTSATELKEIARLSVRGLQEARSRVVAAATEMMQEGSGTWEIRPSDAKDTVHLRLVERNSSSGSNVPIAQLEGLTSAQLTGTGGPVQFRVRRDAGTFTFEGVIRNGVGAGTFAFAPDANFPLELAKRGFTRPTAGEQYQMARHDIGFAFLDELNRQGYAKPQTSDLVRAGQHGVRADYVREMGALGYRLGSLEPLITLRDHGITPAYVREMADQGYKGLAADDLRQARDHGITPEYVRGMRDAGYGSLPMNELIKVRDHGITPEFVRELGDAGHRKLPLDQLLRVRDHGVVPEYVREMRQLGYALPIDELVRARDHGITVQYVREMAALGYGTQPMDSLIRVRDHGVTPQYAQDLKALGYDKLALDDLVTLRDHGLTADRIRAANARAGTRLPVDLLKSLAAGGMR